MPSRRQNRLLSMADVKRAAKKVAATVSYTPSPESNFFEVDAPEGHIWNANELHTLYSELWRRHSEKEPYVQQIFAAAIGEIAQGTRICDVKCDVCGNTE